MAMNQMECRAIRREIRASLRPATKIGRSVLEHCSLCPECWGYLQCALLAAERRDTCPSGFTLASYISGDSVGVDRISVATHLALCEDCAQAVNEAMVLRAELRTATGEHSGFRLIEWGAELPEKTRALVRRWMRDLCDQGWQGAQPEPVPIQGEPSPCPEEAPGAVSLDLLDKAGDIIPGIGVEVVVPPEISDNGQLAAKFSLRGPRDLSGNEVWLYIDVEGRGVLRLGPGTMEKDPTSGGAWIVTFSEEDVARTAMSIPVENIGVVMEPCED